MSFEKFVNCANLGIKRNLKSRKIGISVSISEFNKLSDEYFKKINGQEESFKIEVEKEDLNSVLFILRACFNLWVEQIDKNIILHKKFPEKFRLIKEVNKTNHPFTPKVFPKGTVMYSVNSAYGVSNSMVGTALWDNKNKIEGTELIPSIQINFDYICPIK